MRRNLLSLVLLFPVTLIAQGTKLWTTERFDEVERGTTEGVSVRGNGQIESGPALKLLAETGTPYLWAIAQRPDGSVCAATGGSSAGSAAILCTSPAGKLSKLWSGKELAVQALRATPDGALLAATAPDGKLYRVAPDGTARVLLDPTTTPEKPRYLWDVLPLGDSIYLAAGAPAVLYRIRPGAPPENVLSTADQHVRTLAAAPDGTLWAGTDGAGVIYHLDPRNPAAKAYAAYAAPRREITSLVVAPDGTVYAAGVGTRGPSPLPPLPVTGALGVSLTILTPGSASAVSTNTLLPEGSEIYRIAPDGLASRLVTLRDDVVYALALREGALLAATGNHGRLFRIDLTGAIPGDGLLTDLAHVEAGAATALTSAGDSVLIATSNGGKLFRLLPGTAPTSTYTSEVFDAKAFSQWGRVEITPGSHGFNLEIRTGNVPSPLHGWSDWKPIDFTQPPGLQPGRYAQWRAILHTGAALDGVALNYLPRNQAPTVDAVYVQSGARVLSTPSQPSTTVQVQFPPATPSTPNDSLASPLTAQRDRTAITARWSAHDENNDPLLFTVFFRGLGESTWRLLKDNVTERFLSFDSTLLTDGLYQLRVTASDSPDHIDADTLTAEAISEPFLVDTTPPVPGPLTATLAGPAVHVTFEAHDALSPIAHAEYSLDAGDWQYLEPVGRISDSKTERYDFTIPLSPAQLNQPEHILAVRVYDRAENSSGAKAVVSSPRVGKPGQTGR